MCQHCYRRTAKPSEFRQSYFGTPPEKDGKCEYYWANYSHQFHVSRDGEQHVS
jgi:hypothetical protein